MGHSSGTDRKSTRLNSSHSQISYAVFCLKKKNNLGHNSLAMTPDLLPAECLIRAAMSSDTPPLLVASFCTCCSAHPHMSIARRRSATMLRARAAVLLVVYSPLAPGGGLIHLTRYVAGQGRSGTDGQPMDGGEYSL